MLDALNPRICWGFQVQGWATSVGQRDALAWATYINGSGFDIRRRSWDAGLPQAETAATASPGLRLPVT
jgi:hypothetical protein